MLVSVKELKRSTRRKTLRARRELTADSSPKPADDVPLKRYIFGNHEQNEIVFSSFRRFSHPK